MALKIETLWIPEKPSVAKELTAALVRLKKAKIENSASVMKDGYYALSSGDYVCSVFGHMLQMLPPSRYFTKEQNSDPMPHLPLIPDVFKFEPTPERTREGKIQMKGGKTVVSQRFTVLEKLIKQANSIVNACDIDREGQLIFDELLQYIGRDPADPRIMRTSIVSMTPEALDKAAKELDKNGDRKWLHRGQAAATRQKMDWLLGMNASMAYQVVTGIRTMSVGRVQTPVLAMVVKRDLEIENFKSIDFFVPVVIMPDGTKFRWDKRHGSDGQPGFDPNGRIIDESLAQAIVEQIRKGLTGTVMASDQGEKTESPPLPFSMGSLQSEATKAAQNLYEKHKAITYVGTDCRYMPEAMHDAAPGIINSLSAQFASQAQGANPKIKSKAFNDKKIDEHFAIVPTGTMPQLGASDRAEKGVFETICKRYLAQFYPDSRTATASTVIVFGQDEFKATASKVIQLGWKAIEGKQKGESEDKE